MRRRLALSGILGVWLLSAALSCSLAPAALASGEPVWSVRVTPNADYLIPGSPSVGAYKIEAENIGDAPTTGTATIENSLPAGLVAQEVQFYDKKLGHANVAEYNCPSTSECTFPGILGFFGISGLEPGERVIMVVSALAPEGLEGTLEDVARVSGGGAATVEAAASNEANPEPPFGKLGFETAITNSSGGDYTQAGGHPYQFTTEYDFATYSEAHPGSFERSGTVPLHDPKDIVADLPPGLVANPQAVPHCALADYFAEECAETEVAVGEAGIRLFSWTEGAFRIMEPVLNLQPQGSYPGLLGITIGGAPFVVLTTGLRGSDYGVTATSTAAQVGVSRIRLTLWGVPADESHDALRGKGCGWVSGEFGTRAELEKECEEGGSRGGGPAEVPPTPFITMPTSCDGSPTTIVGRYDSWDFPGQYASRSVDLPPVENCNALQFNPRIEAQPTTNLADSPAGLNFTLHIPQNNDPEGVATPTLKEAIVTLPRGLDVNPGAADGLTGCAPAQIALHTETPAACPDDSKLGTAEAKSALLNEELKGSVFLATPHQNPAGSLLAGYLVLAGQGIELKIPGSFETDQQTGQITAKFTEDPQLPFEDLQLHLFGGARGTLRTPAVCGAYETTSSLTPFSAPESGPAATPSAEFETTSGPTGGECPFGESDLPDAPRFHAGTETPQAGTYSPLSLKLVREDGTQELTGFDVALPPGLLGRLAGIPYCPDADIAAAAANTGHAEQATPSCPAASEVGTVDVGAGAGPTPLYVHGRAYLAGPYKGAPLSIAVITPAVAGPFDLGTVVVRAALHVDPETTQIHAVSDPIPTILEGIPLDLRFITLKMSRSDFTLNPTDCTESGFSGSTTSILGEVVPLAQRFQLGGCDALAFKPKLSLHLKGGTKRTKHPALTAVLKMPPGDANIASAQVTLPHSELLDQSHIGTICTKVQFAANACPAKSVYGQARAFSPLLDQPLEGPVYLRSSSHKLPDLVADLNGQIQVVLAGRVDAVHERLRTSFEAVPDAPVSKFVLQMQGGKKGLVVNQENLCGKHAELKATALFAGQNGKSTEFEPRVGNTCKRHQKPPQRRRSHKRH